MKSVFPAVRSIFNASMTLDEEFPEVLEDDTSADFLRMTVRVKKEVILQINCWSLLLSWSFAFSLVYIKQSV